MPSDVCASRGPYLLYQNRGFVIEPDIIVSIFESIQRQMEMLAVRLDHQAGMVERNEAAAVERNNLTNLELRDVKATVLIQNGSVKHMLGWKDQHQAAHEAGDDSMAVGLAFEAGRKAAVQEPMNAVMRFLDRFDNGFVKMAVGVLLLGAGALVGELI